VSLRNIAQRFKGPSAWSIYRHTKHVQAALLAGIRAKGEALAERLYAELTKGMDCEAEAAWRYMEVLGQHAAGR
jgi:hypothetical protein